MDDVQTELEACRVHQVQNLPGSHHFASDYIEALATDPRPAAKNKDAIFALTADLSDTIPFSDRAMYLSKSTDAGKSWTAIARISSEYFNAGIGEGERNGLAVSPGGADFVITTQRGAFQVIPKASSEHPIIRSIVGPRVPAPDPMVITPKKEGDPETANVVKITRDGKRLIVGYGYFDMHPKLLTYGRARNGSWVPQGHLPPLPTDMDLFSMEFGAAKSAAANSLYVGTGDQAFRLKPGAKQWTQLDGVGDDSAIQWINTVGGPHLAACWGVYNPIDADTVERAIHASFLIHRNEDEAGPDIRAFSVEVDPLRPNRQIVAGLTGAYVSKDGGQGWWRLNDLPDGEYRLTHFNPDGTVIVSGIEGTFLANPFSSQCGTHLKTRSQ